MKNVLVISGHTDLQHDSFNNKIIMADLEKALPEARFEYLDAMYPNFKIDVKNYDLKKRNKRKTPKIINLITTKRPIAEPLVFLLLLIIN